MIEMLGAEGADRPFSDRMDSLVGKIAAEIATAIAAGELKAGAELNSVDLATRFGTSRTPVREALMLLEKEGLVEIPPRRRPRVARIDPGEIGELYAIRETLNDLMIRKYVARAEAEQLADARALVEAMRESATDGDTARFTEHRIALFLHFESGCGNEALSRLLRSSKMRLSVRRVTGGAADDVHQRLADNLRLVAACEARDADLAAALVRSMTRFGRDQVLAEVHRRLAEGSSPAGD